MVSPKLSPLFSCGCGANSSFQKTDRSHVPEASLSPTSTILLTFPQEILNEIVALLRDKERALQSLSLVDVYVVDTGINIHYVEFEGHASRGETILPQNDVARTETATGPTALVQSTRIGTNTATNTISGTSVASPHTAGLLAYLLSLYPSKTFDPDTSTFVSPPFVRSVPRRAFGTILSFARAALPSWTSSMLSSHISDTAAPVTLPTLTPAELKKALLVLATQGIFTGRKTGRKGPFSQTSDQPSAASTQQKPAPAATITTTEAGEHMKSLFATPTPAPTSCPDGVAKLQEKLDKQKLYNVVIGCQCSSRPYVKFELFLRTTLSVTPKCYLRDSCDRVTKPRSLHLALASSTHVYLAFFPFVHWPAARGQTHHYSQCHSEEKAKAGRTCLGSAGWRPAILILLSGRSQTSSR